MQKLIICLAVFWLAWPVAAQAKLTLGTVLGSGGLFVSEAQVYRFAAALEGQLGEEVPVRLFADEATLNEWLSRFRQVDLAVFSRAYLERRPAGEFMLVAEYFRSQPPRLSSDLIVARQGRKVQLIQQIQDVLLAMDAQPGTQQVLRDLGVLRFTLPGTPVPVELTPPPAASVVIRTAPAAAPRRALLSDEQPEITDRARPPVAPAPQSRAAEPVAVAPAAKPPRKAEPPAVKSVAKAPVAKTPASPPSPPPIAKAPPATVEETSPAMSPVPPFVAPPVEEVAETSIGAPILVIAGLLLVGLLVAAGYLLWQLKRLNCVMGGLAAQLPEEDEAGPAGDGSDPRGPR
jgi:hypothetical protein